MMERVVAHRPNLKWYDVEDPCSRFDMETENSIIELKRRTARHSQYDDCMVEHKKIWACLRIAKKKGKKFLFVVYREHNQTYYTFDITQLQADGYDFEWVNKHCKATTTFTNTNYVRKRIGKLYYKDAIDVFTH